MQFKEWLALTENSSRTGAKIGLYPPITDILGQYPPLWGMPKAADLITYYNIHYPNGAPGHDGIINYHEHPHRKFNVTKGNHPGPHQQPTFQKAANDGEAQRYVKYNLPPE
jgi:hypothetical protein